MATRSLTESFVFMRNNAIQNKQVFGIKHDDRERLIKRASNGDIEKGLNSTFNPEIQNVVNAINAEYDIVRQKMKELIKQHDKHLTTTDMNDTDGIAQEIELQTREITELFTLSHKQLHKLGALERRYMETSGNSQRFHMFQNVKSALARTLKDLSLTFRKTQANYLEKLKSRDERIRGYLNIDLTFPYDQINRENLDDPLAQNAALEQWEQRQQMQRFELNENTAMVSKREDEINQIVHSIHDLNEIFRDVAQLVVEQGTVVDRIDYNVEMTATRITEGLNQLTKAQKHQKKNRKMVVILVLAALVVIFGLILILTKFRR